MATYLVYLVPTSGIGGRTRRNCSGLNSAEGELNVHDAAAAISQREEWRGTEAFDDPSPKEDNIDPFARGDDDDPEDKSLNEAREVLAYVTTRQGSFDVPYP